LWGKIPYIKNPFCGKTPKIILYPGGHPLKWKWETLSCQKNKEFSRKPFLPKVNKSKFLTKVYPAPKLCSPLFPCTAKTPFFNTFF